MSSRTSDAKRHVVIDEMAGRSPCRRPRSRGLSSSRLWLLGVFLLLMPLSFIGAASTVDLILQHSPTVVFVVCLIASGRRHPLRDSSYVLSFSFLVLHLVGARYLYSFVPYDDWLEMVFGFRTDELFDLERNHYDRFVHGMFGLLMLAPVRDVVEMALRLRGKAAIVVAFGGIVVISSLYELLEWGVALVMDPEATERYNGQQGDVWDAHKDMALAAGGAILSALWLAFSGSRAARRR